MTGGLRIGACLSLSGKFARFGQQTALGLRAWQSLDGDAELVIEDDQSDRRALEAALPDVAARCDILIGPYSTILMRAAGRIARDLDRLIWNQGGSGDDVEQSYPGYAVSVLTPTSRYAEPFTRFLANEAGRPRDLYLVQGKGSFGRQVIDGAAEAASRSGIRAIRISPDDFPPSELPDQWDLFSAGVFEQDAEVVSKALRIPQPPERLGTISAGVREFAREVVDPEGVFGISQWFAGSDHEVLTGPSEEDFLRAYAHERGHAPDYPAVQVAAGAVLATHCARLAGSLRRDELWSAAASLDTTTLFGGFRINPESGAQEKHETVLVRWKDREPVVIP